MWKDEIVEETRREREAYAAKFDYDLEAIYRELKKRELQGGRHTVSLPPKRTVQFVVTKSAKSVAP